MPGSLKFPPIISSSYAHKPYDWLRTITTATTTSRGGGSVSPIHSSPWRWRIAPCPLPTRCSFPHHLIIPATTLHSRFLGHRRCSYGDGGNISMTRMGTTDRPPASPPSENNNRPEKPRLPPHSDKLLTLPTILTIGRVAAVPLLIGSFYVDSWWGPTATTGIFIAAAITDWLDGYIARKMNLGTTFGAFLDPVADKLMVAATLVLLCTKPFEVGLLGQTPWLLTVPSIAIIGREITMSAVREWAASQGSRLSEAVAVNNLGKWKTATQMTALTILLASRDSSLAGAGTIAASGVVLLYISAWLAVWSLVVYMRKIWKVLLM